MPQTGTGQELCTSDIDAFVEALHGIAPGAVITPLAVPFRARAEMRRMPRGGLFRIAVGESHVVQPAPRSYYSLSLFESGGYEMREGRGMAAYGPGLAHALGVDSPFELDSHAGAAALVVNLDRDLVEAHLRAQVPEGEEPPVLGTGEIPAHHAMQLCLRGRRLWSWLRGEGPDAESPLALAEAEDQLTGLLVRAKTLSIACHDRAGSWLARAEEYLASRTSQTVSLADVARVSGVSQRTLSRGFHRRHGVGVISFLRQRRMDAVHAELRAAERGTTSVTDVALRHGFTHLGRFPAEYRSRFGELPSETLIRPARARLRLAGGG